MCYYWKENLGTEISLTQTYHTKTTGQRKGLCGRPANKREETETCAKVVLGVAGLQTGK